MTLVSIRFDEALLLLDQRCLPHQTRWVTCRTSAETATAIRDMVVRGAPALGITAAYGYALAAAAGEDLQAARTALEQARPTAVNVRWALERMSALEDELVLGRAAPGLRAARLLAEAQAMHDEDVEINRAMGAHGAPLLDGSVLTICNTGVLATGGWGTALGVVRSARLHGRAVSGGACEPRPYAPGARLTTYECAQDEIPCTLIADSMAAAAMQAGRVTSVIVGCDRVARNGDFANKIGTYALAVLARHHGLPFYVAMPTSSRDLAIASGADIPIEERPRAELFDALPEIAVWNPAFDVTPASLVTAWITEHGAWDAERLRREE